MIADVGPRVGRCYFRIGNWKAQQSMATGSREMEVAIAGSQSLADGRGRGRECGGCRGSLGASERG